MTATLWFASIEGPQQVLCPNGTAWPAHDGNGSQIFENTHFVTKIACWDAVISGVEATVRSRGAHVDEAKRQLERAERLAAEAAARYARLMDAREAEKVPAHG